MKAPDGGSGRVICADIAALDQTLVYNRFGSFNPFGMIFALRRDLDVIGETAQLLNKENEVQLLTAEVCDAKTFTERPEVGLTAGQVRLRDCKRPRPVTLRVNVGDTFVLRVTNYLTRADVGETGYDDFEGGYPEDGYPEDGALARPGDDNVIDFSKDFCKDKDGTADINREAARLGVSVGDTVDLEHSEVACPDRFTDPEPSEATAAGRAEDAADWPNTRGVNLVAQGLTPIPVGGKAKPDPACMGTGAVPPGGSFVCAYNITEEGTYFFASAAAPAGGEGDGGSIVHGLFGAVLAEREGSRAYRSQTSHTVFDKVWPRAANSAVAHVRTGMIDYEATDAGPDAVHNSDVPYLNMVMALDVPQAEFGKAKRVEIVHSDLNAIVWCDRSQKADGCVDKAADYATDDDDAAYATEGKAPEYDAFREFSVFFHDELKTFFTKNFEELQRFEQLAGVKDGFAINYGASGMGSILLANRKGIGPAADCMECLYEEFFLASWANGDPALLEWYSDDPSNVHHSYMNDPVVFRNFHAGPKETHVFHLHAHQWFAGNDPNRGAYLDSQTVGPQQGFTYNIYHGGLRGMNGGGDGWWDTQGSGNRNRTVGDSIFHCHLYPHFAQGMWALWRVHDVLEDGTRKLPDGQEDAGLSLSFKPSDAHKRLGSVDRVSGEFLPRPAGQQQEAGEGEGTPIPALIPLPGEPLPLIPTYSDADQMGMPGYPFYIPAEPGHRPPQAPLDIGKKLDGSVTGEDDARPLAVAAGKPVWLDGGLSRHVIKDGTHREMGFPLPPAIVALLDAPETIDVEKRILLMQQVVAKALAMGDMSAHLKDAKIERLPNTGTELERAAMGFHFNGKIYNPDDPELGGTELLLYDVFGNALDSDGAASGDSNMETASPGGSDRLSGQYATQLAPRPDNLPSPRKPVFSVNGSAPKPGAPFADPCGAPRDLIAGLSMGSSGTPLRYGDPLFGGGVADDYGRDPYVVGFRRYEVSAVQLDLIVNKAGWHDPQARINVLTADSGTYKEGVGGISPYISDKDEPFFFRALSGECIEFRHTNELPKDLELDDFQVRTPTDTIGQHIHLVKFDVTSSDGSGNGWNYEDGTFAADELMARKCAAVEVKDENGAVAELSQNGGFDAALYCIDGEVRPEWKEIWKTRLADNRALFQTTTQRWFADPVLSPDENGDPQDRTLRTVFTHDHFGPSSIQQHGFYSALLIEPGVKRGKDGSPLGGDSYVKICPPKADIGMASCSRDIATITDRLQKVAFGTTEWVGATKRILTTPPGDTPDPFHPNAREFALAVADFALLYDPRDRISERALAESVDLGFAEASGAGKGMAQLLCDLTHRASPGRLDRRCHGRFASINGIYGTWHQAGAGDWTPAWLAGARLGHAPHPTLAYAGLVTQSDVDDMREHLVWYRENAAGMAHPLFPKRAETLATPVAAPRRPESISVDHHDPYLVNYRMAAIPIRIGDKSRNLAEHSTDCRLMGMSRPGGDGLDSDVVTAMKLGRFGLCSLNYQLEGEKGDVALAFSSKFHGDPETPIFEAYQGERLLFRMIQGAQEVQHSFQIAGQPFRRNIDQAFPAGALPLDHAFDGGIPTRADCVARVSKGRPGEYTTWSDNPPDVWDELDPPFDKAFWTAHETALAECDNVEGFTFAQEIGISEHFEMKGSLRADQGATFEFKSAGQRSLGAGDSVDKRFSGSDAKTGALVEADATGTFPTGTDLVPATSSDYLYSFGTVDALWNGAWGLVRIYKGTDSADPSTYNLLDLQDPVGVTPISNRLGTDVMVPASERATTVLPVEGANSVEITQSNPAGILTCPIPEQGKPPITVRRAVIAAVEARNVWGEAMSDLEDPATGRYSATRYDPDALVLALVDPAELTDQAGRPLSAATDADWADEKEAPVSDKVLGWPLNLSVAKVHDVVRNAYPTGPQPLVLRANAGDCIEVRLINALQSQDGRDLRDLLGDTVMPAITGLNTDPLPVVPEPNPVSGRLEVKLDPLADPGPNNGGLRPSASLALMFGVPSTELIVDIPLGYGFGKRPMAAPDPGMARVSSVIRFYAGRYRLNMGEPPAFYASLAKATAERMVDEMAENDSDLSKALQTQDLLPGDGGFLGQLALLSGAYGINRQAKIDNLETFLRVDELPNSQQGDPGIPGTMQIAGTKVGLSFARSFDPVIAPVLKSIGVARADAPVLGGDPDLSRFDPERAETDLSYKGYGPSLGAILLRNCARENASEPCDKAVKAWSDAVTTIMTEERDRLLSLKTHWIPYAFGAAPIRAISDPIGQEAHGLIGVVDVVPRDWEIGSTSPASADDKGRDVLVSVPEPEKSDGLWADFTARGPDGKQVRIREFVLFYRDGMNLWDKDSRIRWTVGGAKVVAPFNVDGIRGPDPAQPVPDCHVCDDSYDRGDKGVNYRSPALANRLSEIDDVLPGKGQFVEASDDFNVHVFPTGYVNWDKGINLMACEGQQVVIRIVHPGGRARQRAFVMNGYSYDDLFPSFGFPRGALLAPGKSVTAWLDPEAIKGNTAFWHDGPTSIRSGGVWGRLTVAATEADRLKAGCP